MIPELGIDGWKKHWAKTEPGGAPGATVYEHGLATGIVAGALICPALLLSAKFPELSYAPLLAALHDLGKISPGFACKCPCWLVINNLQFKAAAENWAQSQPDHALTSQWTIQNMLASNQLSKWAALAGAHHGHLKGIRIAGIKKPDSKCQEWEPERRKLAEALIQVFGELPRQPLANDAVAWLIAGIISVADWIASDATHFPAIGAEIFGLRQNAELVLGKIGWRLPQLKPKLEFPSLFPECPRPNAMQAMAWREIRTPGLYLVEAPMGTGKTEAALGAAYNLISEGQSSGLFFALPTQVTSNRIYLRVRDFWSRAETAFDHRQLRLAHSSSWLQEPEPAINPAPAMKDAAGIEHAQAGRSWFSSAKRALLAACGVGTIDQALLGFVAAKHFFVRQFGLAGKTVVLDEIHTYDLYTGTLVEAMIQRLLELDCTVLVLSATLTRQRRAELIALGGQSASQAADHYPQLTVCQPGQPPKMLPIEPGPDKVVRLSCRHEPEEQIAAEMLERAESGQCVLWVRNTVRQAQETFRLLKNASRQGGPPVGLLHSRFPLYRREELETEWITRLGRQASTRPPGCVLAATQVVEQSVDIDADFMVSDLAPTDLLLQRMGRLWRHERSPESRHCSSPEFHFCLPPGLAGLDPEVADPAALKAALGPSGRVYAPYVLLRTLREWRKADALALPNDLRVILEATYADGLAEPEAWRQLREEMERRKASLRQLALSNTSVWSQPELPDEEGIQTRYNSTPTAQLLLLQARPESLAPGRLRASLVGGQRVELDEFAWDFPAAKAIHLNLVRVPRYAVASGPAPSPKWLSLHTHGACVAGVVNEGRIAWLDTGEDSGLRYHPDEGLTLPPGRGPARPAPTEDFYEPCE